MDKSSSSSNHLSVDLDEVIKKIMLRWKINTSLKKWKKIQQKSRRRYKRVEEMMTTEVNYGNDLQLIVAKIQTPLRDGGFIDEEEEKFIFPNIVALIKLSKQIQKELSAILANWDIRKSLIGPPLIRVSNFLILYSDYFKNYIKAKEMITALLSNQKVQEIQKKLAPQNIENYLAKPTQRPMKYHILLADYLKDLPKDHADYQNVTKAIKVYKQVSDKNNESMNEYFNSGKLIALDSCFKDIIGSESRYFITEFRAKSIDQQEYICSILSDLLLVAKQNGKSFELKMKVFLDSSSFVEKTEDGKYLTNKLFICGRDKCIHFFFGQREERDKVYTALNDTIKEIYKKQFNRREAMSRNTANIRGTTNFDNRNSYQARFSYMNTETQVKKRFRIMVVGNERRKYLSVDKETVYYVIRFQLAYPKEIYQLAFVDYEQICKLQKLIRVLYKDFYFTAIQRFDENVVDESKNIELRTILIEQMLNLIFRNETIMKRGDIIAHKLMVSHSIWSIVIDPELQCACNICVNGKIITTIQHYEEQKIQRTKALRSQQKAAFCPNRSIHSQSCVARLDPKSIGGVVQKKLLWLNCQLGRINQSMLKEVNPGNPISIKVNFASVEENQTKEFTIFKDYNVRNVLDLICNSLHLTVMRDFVLTMKIGDQFYILDDDEILADVLSREEKQEQVSFLDRIKTQFVGKADMSIRLFLRKFYVFDIMTQLLACEDNKERYSYIIAEIIYRLKNEQLIVGIKDFKIICALHYAYANFHCLNTIRAESFQKNVLKKVVPDKKWGKVDERFFSDVCEIVQKIKSQPSLNNRQAISKTIIETVNDKPGWNAFFFDFCNKQPERLGMESGNVKIGVDASKIYVRAERSIINQIEIKLKDLKSYISAFNFVISTEQGELIFSGRSVYTLKKTIDFYRAYVNFFGQIGQ